MNLNLNRWGTCKGHKPLQLSNKPKMVNAILCAQPPDSMISFARKQYPNTVIGARYPNTVI